MGVVKVCIGSSQIKLYKNFIYFVPDSAYSQSAQVKSSQIICFCNHESDLIRFSGCDC